jgi:8-oxo-dGTP diphosphatase
MMKQFFVGVKAVIVRDSKVLLVKSSAHDFWDVPGGRIDDDESIEQALRRELSEELPNHTNLRIGKLINAYRVPGSIRGDVGLTLLFYRVDVDFSGDIILSSEHTAWEWMSFDDALRHGSDGIQATMRLLKAAVK